MTLTNLIERSKFGQIVSNYWVVFGVMTLLIIGLVLETSIVSISGFGELHTVREVNLLIIGKIDWIDLHFVLMICIFGDLIILLEQK